MDNFVVSARKYRPATFESVVGQAHITTTLKNAISSGQLAQAFLFTGPRGVGKTTCARILAKTINCLNVGEDSEPCNECVSCKNFAQNTSFNFHELDAASNNSVEDIRNLIEQVRFPPQDGKYKVYIIDEVHMLSTAAFNAFLKTLEEPPSYAIFILATTEKHKILPTILSRCQIFDFNRIQVKDMTEHLAKIAQKEGIIFEEDALELIAQKADGGLRDALSMFDLNVTFSKDHTLKYKEVLENLHILDYDYYLKITDSLYSGNISEVVLILDEIIGKGFDLHLFVVGLNEHFRNLLVCKNPATVHLLELSENIKGKYLQQAQKTDTSFLLSGLSVGSQLDIHFKSAKNQRLHVEVGLLKLSQITAVLSLANLPEGEKKNSESELKSTETVSIIPDSEGFSNRVEEQLKELETINKVPQKQPEAIPIEKKGFVSVRDVLPKKASKIEKPQVETEKEDSEIDETVVSEQSIDEILNDFFGESESANEKMILEGGYTFLDGIITFKLPNTFLMSLFENLKPDLLNFVKQRLNQAEIGLNAELTAIEYQTKPRTEQEKYEALLEINPVLKDMRKSLDLDLLF